MTFSVHKMTSRLARTLKLVQARFLAQGIQKSNLKPLKITVFELLYRFAEIWVWDNQASKKYVALLKNENFFLLCVLHSLNFLSSKNEVLFFFH